MTILAFLFTSTHVDVDHRGRGQKDFVFIPHGGVSSHSHDNHDRGHEPSDTNDPFHHDADTHSHFEWFTTAGGSDVPSPSIPAAGFASDDAWMAEEPLGDTAPFRLSAFALPPPDPPLYLCCCALLA